VQRQLRRLTVAYATLSETNQAIVRSATEPEMLQRVCTIAVDFGGYLGAWIGLVDARTGEVKPVANHGPIEAYVNLLRLSVDPTRPEGQGPAGLAIRSGLPRYSDDFLADPATVPWQEKAREFGIRAHAVLPLRRGGAVAGVLTLCSAEPGAFDTQTRALLEEMAVDVSFALDNFDRKTALAEWTERYEATVKASGQILLDRDLATGASSWAGTPGASSATARTSSRARPEGGPASSTPTTAPPSPRRWTASRGRAGLSTSSTAWCARTARPSWCRTTATFVHDAAGGTARMVGFVADVTERRLAEDRIRSQLDELRRWHSAMLGREVRILQLKREVNEVLAQAGKPPATQAHRPSARSTRLSEATLLSLAHNVAVLIAMGLVFHALPDDWLLHRTRARDVVLGALAGAMAVVLMLAPWQYVPGIFFDARSVLLAVSGSSSARSPPRSPWPRPSPFASGRVVPRSSRACS